MTLAPPTRFALSAVAWTLGLFALFRTSWIEQRFVQGLIDAQSRLALWYGATPSAAVVVDASCSGTDLVALCAAIVLAYPAASWQRRLLGAAGGVLLLLTLNTIRIGTLMTVGPSSGLFDLLHVYVWPGALMVAAFAYVLTWIAMEGREGGDGQGRNGASGSGLRFAVAAVVLLTLHAASAPWMMTSATLLEAGVWTAGAGGAVLSAIGVAASADANILVTERGAFQVTQECLLTPMTPLYLAAVLVLPARTHRRWLALAMAVPVFFALGVLRVLVLALPPAIVTSPLFLSHGFYQVVASLAIVVWVAQAASRTSAGNGPAFRVLTRAALAATCAVLVAWLAGDLWAMAVSAGVAAGDAIAPHALTGWAIPGDVQGALPLMPGFQLALCAALWIASGARRSPRLLLALVLLAVSQALCLLVLGELAFRGATVHALALRAWSIGIPLGLWWWLLFRDHLPRTQYQKFWHGVGAEFPDLRLAASTRFYRENEIRLLTEHLPNIGGSRLLKTDLWDEARNTEILQWATEQGAHAYGIDLSEPTLRQARSGFGRTPLRAAVADVRYIPLADASVDAIYSMGTIEHFDDSEGAVREMARVLTPGGRLILGVPNRHDPFLRPLMVAVLWRLGWYGYGFEKSYSRRALRQMMERAGFTVVAETGILFIPGWLRMLDLACHVWCRPLARVTAAAVAVFGWLDRRVPRLRRHGYLLASVGIRDGQGAQGAQGAQGCPRCPRVVAETAPSGPCRHLSF